MLARLCIGLVLILGNVGCATHALSSAAENGNIEEVRAALRRGADPDGRDFFGGQGGPPPLLSAVARGDIEVVRALIAAGANVNIRRWGEGDTAIILASSATARGSSRAMRALRPGVHFDDLVAIVTSAQKEEKRPELVRDLIAAGADVNAVGNLGEGALSYAVSDGDVGLVQVLLTAGASPSFVVSNEFGARCPVLVRAVDVDNPNLEIVRKLVAAGADVNARTNEGDSALAIAAGRGHTDVVRAFLNKGAAVNDKASNGATPLCAAAGKGNVEIVRDLIAAGADVNAKTNEGDSALVIAAGRGHTDVVRALLDKGAAVNDKASDGATPLCAAAKKGNVDMLRALLGAKASPDVLCDIEYERKRITRRVIVPQGPQYVRGAPVDYSVKFEEGERVITKQMTALMVAAAAGQYDAVKELVMAGAAVGIKSDGFTASSLAARSGHQRILEFLKEAESSTPNAPR